MRDNLFSTKKVFNKNIYCTLEIIIRVSSNDMTN